MAPPNVGGSERGGIAEEDEEEGGGRIARHAYACITLSVRDCYYEGQKVPHMVTQAASNICH